MSEIIIKGIDKFQWALLLVFVVGYILTKSYFDFASYEYFIYNLAALGVCALIIYQLRRSLLHNAAAWLALFVIVTVYYLRSYWITLDPMPVKVMLPRDAYVIMLGRGDLLLDSFKFSTLMFLSFGMSITFLLNLLNRGNFQKETAIEVPLGYCKFLGKVLLVMLPLVMLVLYFLTYYFQIGLMGGALTDPLPFRLKGVIFYASTVFIPLLIALLIYLSEKSNGKTISNLGVLLMILHGLVMMLLRGSRGSLLLSIVLLIFLVAVGGLKLQRNQKILMSIFIIVGFFMVPVMTNYRSLRVEQAMLLPEAISMAMHLSYADLAGTFVQGVKFILFRMPGIESLWCMLARGAEPLGGQLFDVLDKKNGIAGFLTHNIYTLSDDTTLIAPGFVGWFYLIGGFFGVVLGGVFAALLSVLSCVIANKKYLKCGVIAQVFLLWMLFLMLTEGTLDIMVMQVLSGLICLATIEYVLRASAGTIK